MDDFIDNTYERVEQIIHYKNLNISSFEGIISVSNNSVGTAIKRATSFKSNVLNKILNCFPEINPTWLLTGKGDMFVDGMNTHILKEPKPAYTVHRLNKQVKICVLDLLLTDENVKTALSSHIETTTNNKLT